MNTLNQVYLSIGSNIGIRHLQLQKALLAIAKNDLILKISAVYENAAIGFDGDDFLNACVLITTKSSASELLAKLQKIEADLGRKKKKGAAYVSRNIDIDILYFNNEIINGAGLTIPHPRMAERNFVLKPLADIAPQFYHPVLHKDTRNLLQECKDKSKLHKTEFKLYKNREDLFSIVQFLAIEGNIGAGKSTLAKKIAEDFNAKLVLERFADNAFLPKFYEDPTRYAFPLEMSFLADRFQQFTDDTSQFDLFKRFMVSDYDIYKSLIFAKITLQKEEFELYRKVFNFMHNEVKKPDIYVYLYQNKERLLTNIKNRGRDYEQNISPTYLEKINRGYLDFIKSHPNQNILLINLEELDFINKSQDYENILEQLETYIIKTLF